MNPSVGRFLQVAATYLMTGTGQALGPGYEQSNVFAMSVMLLAVGEEFDRAAARRAEENRALRELFAEAAGAVDGELAERLASAATSQEESLAVSDLERANAELRALLIELHAAVEEDGSPAARRIEDAIWRELAASTVRRRLSMGPF